MPIQIEDSWRGKRGFGILHPKEEPKEWRQVCGIKGEKYRGSVTFICTSHSTLSIGTYRSKLNVEGAMNALGGSTFHNALCLT